MSDISKIKVDNTTYDIKDANARCSKYQYTLNKNNWSNNTYALSVSASNIDCKCYNTIELSNYYDINQWKIYGISIESTEKNYDGSTDTTTLATIYFKCETVPGSNLNFTIVSFPFKTSVDGDLVNPYNGNNYTNADKALVQNSPITTAATGSDLALSTSAGNIGALTVYGKSEVVDGEIVSAGEGWATIKLADLEWTAYPSQNRFFATLSNAQLPANDAQKANIICAKYVTRTWDDFKDFVYDDFIAGVQTYIGIRATNCTTVSELLVSLGDETLCYQLADPTQGNCIAVKTDNGSGINGTMAVFETGTPLRGIPDTDIRDVMQWDGTTRTVTKVCGKVRLADLAFGRSTSYNEPIFYSSGLMELYSTSANTKALCSKYTYFETTGAIYFANNAPDKTIGFNTEVGGPRQLYIKDLSYNTPVDLMASFGNTELVYELAVSTTEQLTTAENDSIAGLKTFSPTTHISNNASTDMTVEAYAGTANGQAITEIADKIDVLSSDKETKSVELSYADYVALPTKDPETSYYVPDAPGTWIFGYDLDKDDENPFTRVSYPADVDNTFYTPAFMDFTNDVFNYGSWNFKPGDKFMPNPCMLLYNGTVGYYLDPNDNTKKADGTASDVADTSYGGNAMMEWGLLYTKRWEENGVYKFRVSNVRIDADWECWCNYDINNNVIPHFYTPIYFGSYDGTRMRSLSGQSNMVSTTRQQEIDRAMANGEGWYTEVYADSLLFQDLCIMMSRCTDVQTAFGTGRVKRTNTGAIAPGTMNTKGMFWGSTDQTSGVKIFGMENPYGNLFRGKAGYMYINGVQTVKMTRGTYDGSTATDYNITGSGYIAIPDSTISASGWQKSMTVTPYGRFPKTIGGASNKYESDYVQVNNSGTFYLLSSCNWNTDLYAGFCVFICFEAAFAIGAIGAALSCKPVKEVSI